ncbi:MAG: efflux RND transporter periplasmic adaptor subunit [Gammaproteobacteria bacterium]
MMLNRFLLVVAFVLPITIHAQQGSTLASVKAENVSSPLEYHLDGVIEAINQSTLSAQVSGRIEEVNFDVDDRVNAGEVILRIRDNEYRARLQRNRASLAEAKANLKDAQQEFKRVEELIEKKLISKANFDKAKTTLTASEARVAASKALVTESQEQLDNTVIRAPFSGVVVTRHIELGETTYVGQKLMTGYAPEYLRVNVSVPQSLISAVRQHRSARVILLENKISIATENLTIFPYANAENHSFQLRADLHESAQAIFPGMLVKVAFIVGQTQRLMVPADSLVYRSEVVGLYVIDENAQLSFRQVRAGDLFGDEIEILAGLEANENIAIDPIQAGIYLKAQTVKQ